MKTGICHICKEHSENLSNYHLCFQCDNLYRQYYKNIYSTIVKKKPYIFNSIDNKRIILAQLYSFFDFLENQKKICSYSKAFYLKILSFIENDQQKQETPKTNDIRERWPREHRCEDGHYVRSLSEMIIDNWLYSHGYVHSYEKKVFMKSNPEEEVLSDFYLPQGNVYIEFWGLENNKHYQERKKKKIELYNKNNYKRIDLTEKDIKHLDDILPKLLSQFI